MKNFFGVLLLLALAADTLITTLRFCRTTRARLTK